MTDRRRDFHARTLYGLIVFDSPSDWKSLTQEQRESWIEVAAAFRDTIIPPGYVVVEGGRIQRLIAAADKLRRFSRSIVGYGGHVPESENLQDADLEPLSA